MPDNVTYDLVMVDKATEPMARTQRTIRAMAAQGTVGMLEMSDAVRKLNPELARLPKVTQDSTQSAIAFHTQLRILNGLSRVAGVDLVGLAFAARMAGAQMKAAGAAGAAGWTMLLGPIGLAVAAIATVVAIVQKLRGEWAKEAKEAEEAFQRKKKAAESYYLRARELEAERLKAAAIEPAAALKAEEVRFRRERDEIRARGKAELAEQRERTAKEGAEVFAFEGGILVAKPLTEATEADLKEMRRQYEEFLPPIYSGVGQAQKEMLAKSIAALEANLRERRNIQNRAAKDEADAAEYSAMNAENIVRDHQERNRASWVKHVENVKRMQEDAAKLNLEGRQRETADLEAEHGRQRRDAEEHHTAEMAALGEDDGRKVMLAARHLDEMDALTNKQAAETLNLQIRHGREINAEIKAAHDEQIGIEQKLNADLAQAEATKKALAVDAWQAQALASARLIEDEKKRADAVGLIKEEAARRHKRIDDEAALAERAGALRRSEDLQAVETESQIMLLEAAGRADEARLLQMTRTYDQRIAQAEQAAEAAELAGEFEERNAQRTKAAELVKQKAIAMTLEKQKASFRPEFITGAAELWRRMSAGGGAGVPPELQKQLALAERQARAAEETANNTDFDSQERLQEKGAEILAEKLKALGAYT